MQASGCRERAGEEKNCDCGCSDFGGGAFGGGESAGAGFAGEFQPRVPDLDWWRARDQWEHVGYGCLELGVAVWTDFDQPAWTGIFEGATGVRV